MEFIVGNGKTITELWKSGGNAGGAIAVKTLTGLTIYAKTGRRLR
jgi:hypothetical protein